jgi:WD40 repeat protein
MVAAPTFEELDQMRQKRWELWGTANGCRIIEGHRANVRALCAGALNNRTVVASGDESGVILLHDLETGHPVGRPIRTRRGSLVGLVWIEPDTNQGRLVPVLVSATGQGVSYWDPILGTEIGNRTWVEGLTCVAVGTAFGERVVATGTGDGTVQLWRPVEGVLLGEIYAGSDGTEKVHVLGRDRVDVERVGKVGIAPGERFAEGARIDRERVDQLFSPRAVAVRAVAFTDSPEPAIAAVTSEMELFVWNLAVEPPAVQRIDVFPQLTALEFASYGHRPALAYGSQNGEMTVLSLQPLAELARTLQFAAGAKGEITSLKFADLRDFGIVLGDFVVFIGAGRDGLVHVWGPRGERLGRPWAGHTAPINAIIVVDLAGWPVVASASDDQTVRFWDLAEFAQEKPSTTAREQFAAKLEEWRLRYLRPTADVAGEVGVSTSTFWSWVHGRSLPRGEAVVDRLERSLSDGGAWARYGELVALYRAAVREKKIAQTQDPPRRLPPAKTTTYDLFISYNHRDRGVVQGLADRLRRSGIRLWYDRWEMKPGDVLRNRIGEGIAGAKHFMVLISKSSLNSNWVKYELNSGMIDEIESGATKVIPVLGPGVSHEDLPADLRAKYCLDVRTEEGRTLATQELIDLIQPAKRQRHERLHELRQPAGDKGALQQRRDALKSHDHSTLLAGIRGLERTPGSEAVLGLAEASFRIWHPRMADRCLNALRKRHADGGILALTASLLLSRQYFNAKIHRIRDFLEKDNPPEFVAPAQYLSDSVDFRGERPARVAETVRRLIELDLDDIRHGCILARLGTAPNWAHDVPDPTEEEMTAAIGYADDRLPGLCSLLASNAWRRSS